MSLVLLPVTQDAFTDIPVLHGPRDIKAHSLAVKNAVSSEINQRCVAILYEIEQMSELLECDLRKDQKEALDISRNHLRQAQERLEKVKNETE